MPKVSRSIRIERPPEVVFAWITDVVRFPQWQKVAGIKKVEVLDAGPGGQLRQGSRFRIQRESRGKTVPIDATVATHDSPREFAFTTQDDDGFRGTVTTRLSAAGAGTALHWEMDLKSPLLYKLMSPLIAREMGKAADGDFGALKSQLEGGQSSASAEGQAAS